MSTGEVSSWPHFTQEEADAVQRVLLSNKVNYWTGQEGREFEREFAGFAQTEHAIAVANGTVALDLAWQALNLPIGSEVIVTSRTFIASISSIVLAGLTPVFADIDRDTQNISAATITPLISDKTSAILCVHLAGWPCEMDEILALAKGHQLYVVEDCAQAHGATYKSKPVGGLGDIAAWSFCQDKIMTTAGEGGMVTTNNKPLWEKVWSFKDHGKSWQAIYEKEHPPGFRWLHDSFGTNWRMMEMQAAVGIKQLEKMPSWTAARNQYSNQIFATARGFCALRVPEIPDHIEHAFYKCYVFVKPENLNPGWNRDRIIAELTKLEIPCFSGSCSEVYKEKAFNGTDYRPKETLLTAIELGETSLMFLVHPTLKQQEVDLCCEALSSVMRQASKEINL